MIKINKIYFALTLLLLLMEILIGSFMHDAVIRPSGGDFLVVILFYCFVKSFVNKPVLVVATGVLIFAYLIEVSQYFHLVRWLGLQHSAFVVMILGNTFSWADMLCYTLGIALVIIIEKIRLSNTVTTIKPVN